MGNHMHAWTVKWFHPVILFKARFLQTIDHEVILGYSVLFMQYRNNSKRACTQWFASYAHLDLFLFKSEVSGPVSVQVATYLVITIPQFHKLMHLCECREYSANTNYTQTSTDGPSIHTLKYTYNLYYKYTLKPGLKIHLKQFIIHLKYITQQTNVFYTFKVWLLSTQVYATFVFTCSVPVSNIKNLKIPFPSIVTLLCQGNAGS